jgi:hypothetical protein
LEGRSGCAGFDNNPLCGTFVDNERSHIS